jgi:transcriptional regulator with XRE-family HTH domain
VSRRDDGGLPHVRVAHAVTMIRRAEPKSEGVHVPAGATPAVSRRSGRPEPWELGPLRELGRVMQAARLAAGLSLEDLGPIAGSRDGLDSIERGKVRTRASRLRPWCAALGVDPEPIIERFAAVLAPERPDGRNAWRAVPPVERREPRALALPPLEAWAIAAAGAELWRIRCAAGLTRPRLAELLGCSRVHVWCVERGARRPSAELVNAWLTVAGGRSSGGSGPRMPREPGRSSRKSG